MSINGIKDFENSLDLQNRLYVRRDGVNHIVDYRRPFEPIGNVGGSGSSSRRKYDVTDEASNMIKKKKVLSMIKPDCIPLDPNPQKTKKRRRSFYENLESFKTYLLCRYLETVIG